MVIYLWRALAGILSKAIAMAASSTVYRFCSSLVPRVIANLVTVSLVLLKRLVTITMPMALLAILVAFSRSALIIGYRRGAQGAIVYFWIVSIRSVFIPSTI
ncbi:uncharacterized protein B0T15DRAFT_522474 [Chaetomium strumarium]|uniref:Uncharacterized protein n=1 Tax=Chaetomium strumarium TaxID=1170767 RepID=A0AAJ0M3L5_9PEZI|nr:hypothetical protein B0T15DRAFT_522474 [Chaetomium strumarium]